MIVTMKTAMKMPRCVQLDKTKYMFIYFYIIFQKGQNVFELFFRLQNSQDAGDSDEGDDDDDDEDDDEKDDDDADDSEDEDEESEDEEEDEDDTINISSSMLGGESEVSAMSEDISLPSLSITPSKKSTTQSKQGTYKFIELNAKTLSLYSVT